MKKLFVPFALLALLLPSIASATACASLTDHLTSFWKYDESSGNPADSVGTNTLTNNNTATFNTGLINNAAYVATSGPQYFSITNAVTAGLQVSSSFSVNGWAYLTGKPTSSGPIGSAWGGGTKNAWIFDLYNSAGTEHIEFVTNNGSSNTAADFTPTVTLNSWHMWTGLFDGTNCQIYLDGTSLGTAACNAAQTSTASAFEVANRADLNTSASGLGGRVDAEGFWACALTSAQVTSLYNGGAGEQYPFSAPAVTPSVYQTILFW